MTEDRKCPQCNRNTCSPGDTLCRSCRMAQDAKQEFMLAEERRREDRKSILFRMRRINYRLNEYGKR